MAENREELLLLGNIVCLEEGTVKIIVGAVSPK